MMKILILFVALFILFAIAVYLMFARTCVRKFKSDTTENLILNNAAYTDYVEEYKKEREFYNNAQKEDFFITAFDGVKLHASFFDNNSNKTIIFMHGYRSSGGTDFSISLRYYLSLGYNLLVPDQRAHSKSGGRFITFGASESKDLKQWCEEICRIKGGSIYLVGMSMGATTVLLASGMALPSCVKAAVADCGFYEGYTQVMHTAKSMCKYIPEFAIKLVNFMCRIFADFDLRDSNTLKAVKHSCIPLLFIHGTEDAFVPCEMTLRNFNAANCEKELLTVPKASHGMSYLVDRPLYQKTVNDFLSKY